MTVETFEALKPFMFEEDFDIYNSMRKEHMASSALGTFRDESPADYLYEYQFGEDQDSAARAIGRAYHTLILEGTVTYQERFTWDSPVNPSTGKPYGYDTKAFNEWASFQTRQFITSAQHNLAVDMRTALLQNKEVQIILQEGIAERVIRTKYCGVACQIRPDWTSPHRGMVDLKTTKSLKWFLRDAEWNYGYFHNAAFYRALSRVVLTQAGLEFEDLPFLLIAQETKPPYKSAVYDLHSDLLDRFERQNQQALLKFVECINENKWPTGYEGIELIE